MTKITVCNDNWLTTQLLVFHSVLLYILSTPMTVDVYILAVIWLSSADNTVLLSLLSESSWTCFFQDFIDWFDSACLELNVSKHKEMVVHCSKMQRDLRAAASSIMGNECNWLKSTDIWLPFLTTCSDSPPTLRRFSASASNASSSWGNSIPLESVKTFYYSFVESIITFSITCYHSITIHSRNQLQRTVWVCSKIISLPVRFVLEFHDPTVMDSYQ